MTRYVIHARRFAGTLDAPTRNEIESAGADDYPEAIRVAETMAARGWSVWVYEDTAHGAAASRDFTPHPAAVWARLRTVGEWRPDGTRVR